MNLGSQFRAQNWRNSIGINGLKLALTPALSPEERENTFPRLDNLQALDLTRFRGSMREIGWGNSLPGPRLHFFVEARGTNQRAGSIRERTMSRYAPLASERRVLN